MKPADCQKAARRLKAMLERVEATAYAHTPRQRAARTLAINRLAQEARRLYERNAASQPPATSECEPTLEHAYAEGRADEREDMRTLLQQTRCVRDGWHTFTALTMQTELLAAIDDASEHLTHQNNTA